MITSEIVDSINHSVLCWLATTSVDGSPNVSPKEAFYYDGADRILVANIASPTTVQNIAHERRVCLSFVNVFTQKGYKIKGDAMNIIPGHPEYEKKLEIITSFIGTDFPIVSIVEIIPQSVAEIIAPSYRLFPETGRGDRIRESLETYQVSKYQKESEAWQKRR